jgi:hypothetical protein
MIGFFPVHTRIFRRNVEFENSQSKKSAWHILLISTFASFLLDFINDERLEQPPPGAWPFPANACVNVPLLDRFKKKPSRPTISPGYSLL